MRLSIILAYHFIAYAPMTVSSIDRYWLYYSALKV